MRHASEARRPRPAPVSGSPAAVPSVPLAHSRLVALGARATRTRIDVLATLIAAERALTHHEIEARLEQGREVDRVTLYRVLDWLTAQGLAHKLSGDDRVWRFSFTDSVTVAGGHAHAHFQCSDCGKVICLAEARLPAISLPRGFRRRAVEVTVKGSCDQCAPT
ncbi:MAG: transcriptional repressor [Casimicrobiaceae bacterium]